MDLDTALSTLWDANELAMLPSLAFSLVLAALLGVVLSEVYARFGTSMSNRRAFARNFLLLTVTTTLVISIVKTSLALSLGLVGALSIVRFRAAIKEPEELGYLFLALSIGLGLGAGKVLVTVFALFVIVALVVLRSFVAPRPDRPNLHLTVSSAGASRLTSTQLVEVLSRSSTAARLARYDEGPDGFEAAFVASFDGLDKLEQFTAHLKELAGDVRVTCLDTRGLDR